MKLAKEKRMTTQLTFSDLYQQQKVAAPRRRVCDLPAEERPLYRLHQAGSRGLATTELLALVLGSGDGPGLAAELLATFGSLHQLARASQAQLMSVNGIGTAQAARLLALLELSCRLQEPPAVERPRITNPAEGAALLTPRMAHLEQEELWVVLLDTRNRVLKVVELYKGSLNASVVRVGEIFRPAIEMAAAAILVAHNHPSSDPSPSPEDVSVTRQIVQAGKMLDIGVLDHLIIASQGYTSMKEKGLAFD
jgi:DNA repair protein RadC